MIVAPTNLIVIILANLTTTDSNTLTFLAQNCSTPWFPTTLITQQAEVCHVTGHPSWRTHITYIEHNWLKMGNNWPILINPTLSLHLRPILRLKFLDELPWIWRKICMYDGQQLLFHIIIILKEFVYQSLLENYVTTVKSSSVTYLTTHIYGMCPPSCDCLWLISDAKAFGIRMAI